MDEANNENTIAVTDEDKKFRIRAGIFLASVAGLSAIAGFGTTVAFVKRQDPKHFSRGMIGSIEMADTGANLALRALGWGTVYAFSGCGLLFYTIWKLSGAKDLKDFRQKMGNLLPKLTKNEQPTSRTEFKNLTDLLNYLNTDYGKNKSKD